MRTEVVLVPVAVGVPSSEVETEMGDGHPPALHGLTDHAGAWFRVEAKAGTRSALDQLLAVLPEGFRDLLTFNGLTPTPVGFVDESNVSGVVSLIYSVAVPSAFLELPATDADAWTQLVTPERSFADARERGSAMIGEAPYAELLLDFWRQALEETTAVFAFLPQYFTLRQMREVYSAVWAYDQDFNAFKSWALERPKRGVFGSYVEEVGKDVPSFDQGTTFRVDRRGEVVVEVHSDPSVADRIGERLKTARGAALFGGRGSVVGAVAAPVLLAAGPGALLSYVTAAAIHSHSRSNRTAGQKPTWYMRTSPQPVVDDRLTRVYSPRPAWMYSEAAEAGDSTKGA